MKNILAKIGMWIYNECVKPLPNAVFRAALSAIIKTWLVAIITLIISIGGKAICKVKTMNLAA